MTMALALLSLFRP